MMVPGTNTVKFRMHQLRRGGVSPPFLPALPLDQSPCNNYTGLQVYEVQHIIPQLKGRNALRPYVRTRLK